MLVTRCNCTDCLAEIEALRTKYIYSTKYRVRRVSYALIKEHCVIAIVWTVHGLLLPIPRDHLTLLQDFSTSVHQKDEEINDCFQHTLYKGVKGRKYVIQRWCAESGWP